MAKKSFAVIGLGQFGCSVVKELISNGSDVIAIDNNEEAVNKVKNILPTVFVADSTDEQALKELGIGDVDTAVIAFGDNKEASVLTTVILREFGIPRIIVRVDDEYYGPIMKKLGANEIITPQKEAGVELANRLGSDDYKGYYKVDDTYSVVSIQVKNSYIPKTLAELNSKVHYGVNIVLISRNGKSLIPGGNDSILPNDNVYVVGSNKDIKTFREVLNG